MREEGVLATGSLPEDMQFDVGLRPTTLDEFVGQTELKERLSILIEAAKARGEAVDHLLFSGPPGLGKTSLASIVKPDDSLTRGKPDEVIAGRQPSEFGLAAHTTTFLLNS